VLFINGLPLVLLELKNAADENATIWSAYQQIQTYKAELPMLFAFNGLLVISDGMEARIGTLTAGREWFKPIFYSLFLKHFLFQEVTRI
jgi:type I restriction enzyme, R subunit